MEPEPEGDAGLATYESFPDLRRLLEEECAEIERRELEAKASLEERIRRRNSDALSDTGSSSSSSTHHGSAAAAEHSGFRIIGSLYRIIDPLRSPALASSPPEGPARGGA
ncbi:hypothetical protein H4R21_005628 [Coemansia helicoidea]|uniref:Uncharacterized protein n=1 Tax=Coemansia helicoidea TaxID=1286919 RepID=A0ACC1KRY5_9FUNG|nr:hypothetical protein H4R21_005628 [Coemansia helicoidea]